MKKLSIALFALSALLIAGTASATEFQIREGMSSASFTSDALLETINGTSSAVTGSVSATLSNPGSVRGSVTIPVTSLRTGVDLRDEHLHGSDWLNAEANPNITFEVTGVRRTGGASQLTHGQEVQAEVTGNLSINGQTQQVTAPATMTYYEISGDEVAGTYGLNNNVLRVQTSFTIELADFGINIPAPMRTKVANELSLNVRLTAVQQ